MLTRRQHVASNRRTIFRSVPVDELAHAERLRCDPIDEPDPDPNDPGRIDPDPLPIDPGTPFVLDAREAARLLTQATFGPTPAKIDALVALGDIRTWIDRQIDEPTSQTLPYVRANSNGSKRSTRHHVWWGNAVDGPDQLRQRVTFALSQIFVVSDRDYELGNSQYGICAYYDMLANDAFGNFRTLLERVTLHPVMGIYLSMLRNERADPSRNIRPDENFAREVLQLFTIGLYELAPDGSVRTDASGEPIPTYDQATVEQFAKVFTGWNLAGTDDWSSNDLTSYDKELPMVPVEEYHDTSSKTLLNGVTLPAGRSARDDMTSALDNIFEHPNVGPFVATALIKRLVTSNPTTFYVGRVAAAFDDDGSGVRGNLRAVIAAILLDVEARSGHVALPDTFGKAKEPIMRLTQVWRAFDAQFGPTADGVYHPYGKALDQIDSIIGQAPLESPSVFNFFSPDHPLVPDGRLRAPEAQLLSEINVASMNNLLHQVIYNDNSAEDRRNNVTWIRIDRELALATDAGRLVDHLDLLLAAGGLPTDFTDAVIAHVDASPTDADGRVQRVADAIFCIVGSPFHLVQK